MAPVNLEALLPVSGADAEPAQEAAILVEAFLEPLLEAAEPVLAEGGVVDPDPAPVPAPEPAPNPLDTPPPQAAMQMAAPAIEPAAKIVARPSRSRPKTPPKG